MKCEKCKKEFTGQLYDGYCRFCAREESAVALSDGLCGLLETLEKNLEEYQNSRKYYLGDSRAYLEGQIAETTDLITIVKLRIKAAT